jgi:myo-inositol-1-phosphate synthase
MKPRKIGVWLIGALGSISTTVVTGVLALRKGLISSTGMITTTDAFRGLGFVGVDDLEFGGCDVRSGSLWESARDLSSKTRAIDERILTEIEEDLASVQQAIQPGTARNCGEAIERLVDFPVSKEMSLREEISEIRKGLRRFREGKDLKEVVVVNLSSTEPPLDLQYCHADLAAFEACLDKNDVRAVRASTLYAYAAIKEGCPYINFTPSNGALIPAMVQLAGKKGVPVMGNDGKTGETLVKSALAPMFACRNLEVLSWEGFNILGNMDGQVLDHPGNRESKIRTKDHILSKILGYAPHSRVRIDYVPSLDDQKTAWNFIHFEGFFGAKMSLQFVWQGYDSLLAAPLVLDMVRLAELAKRRGEVGLMPHLASFFKAPLGVDEHRLFEQFQMLLNYVDEVKTDRKRLQRVI